MTRTNVLPISSAQWVTEGTIAILHMANGRRYDAIWAKRGNLVAWWPIGSRRKKPIGLYTPVGFEIDHGIIKVAERVSLGEALDMCDPKVTLKHLAPQG